MTEGSDLNHSRFQRIQMAGTMLSRVFGLVRIQIINAMLGDGRINDIFQAAFKVVNVFRNSIGEEAVKNSFLPFFKKYQDQDENEYRRFLSQAISLLLAVLIPLVVGGILLSPYFMPLLTPGFDPEDQQTAITLARLLFPFLIFIGLSAFFMGLLYSEEKTWAHLLTSLAPIAVTITVFVLYYFRTGISLRDLLFYLALAQVIGASMQFLVVALPYYLKGAIRFVPALTFSHDGIREVIKQWVPAAFGSAVVQINLLFDTFLATYAMPGAVMALSTASRIFHLPVGLFGVSSAVSLHSTLARHWVRSDRESLKTDFFWGLKRINYYAIPSAAGLIIMGQPIATSLFQYGRFGKHGVDMVALCMVFYGIGIPFFCTNKLLKTTFSASQDNRSYALGDGLTVGVNIILCLTLFTLFGWLGFPRYPGIALGTSLASAFQCKILAILLSDEKRMGTWKKYHMPLLKFLLKILISTVMMGIVIAFCMQFLDNEQVSSRRLLYIGATLGIILLGLGVYGIFTYLFKVEESVQTVKKIRKLIT